MNVLGLKNESLSHKYMSDYIFNAIYARRCTAKSYKGIQSCFVNENEKFINPQIRELCGIYPFKSRNVPLLKMMEDEFFPILRNLIAGGQTHHWTYSTTAYKKKVDMRLTDAQDRVNEIRSQIRDDFAYIETAPNRKEKFLKGIKKILSDYIEISDVQFEELKIVQKYNQLRNCVNKDTYIVITNSIMSTLGMSSYAPMAGGNPYVRTWRSCQTLNDQEYSSRIWANLGDPNSLVMYVTDLETVPLYNQNGLTDSSCNEYSHYKMMQRNILRVSIDNKTGEPYMFLDRAYPNNAYTLDMYKLLLELSASTGIKTGCVYNFAEAQSNYYNSTSLHNIIDNAEIRSNRTEALTHVTTPYPITGIVRGRILKHNYSDQPRELVMSQTDRKWCMYNTQHTLIKPEYIKL